MTSEATIRRGVRNSRYSAIPNHVFEDDRLSMEARWLLSYLLSKPENWTVVIGDIVKKGNCGRDKARKMIAELVQFGYAEREQQRDGGKFGSTALVIFDEPRPMTEAACDPVGESVAFLPQTDLPAPVLPAPAKSSPSNNLKIVTTENQQERESVREGLEGKAAADPSESREAIERAFMRFFPKWPTYVADSQPAARKAWFALTAEERIDAAERMADYLAADKAAGRKYHCSAGAYLAEKRWLKLPEPLKEPERPKMAAPFGKAWSALRLRELLKPMAHLPKLPSVSQYLVDQGGEKAELILRDHRERHGWPKVTDMHEKAKGFAGVSVPPDMIAASQHFQPVKVGSELEAAWRRLHERWQWPWMPDPGKQEWLYFPAIDLNEPDLDKAVASAVFEFKARIGDHVHAAAE